MKTDCIKNHSVMKLKDRIDEDTKIDEETENLHSQNLALVLYK